MENGNFVISLDFELFWGVRDKRTIDNYGRNIIGVHTVIPKLLNIFKKYNIKSTFSSVGFLFFKNKTELLNCLPNQKPDYYDKNLSPYNHFDSIANEEDKYHFASDLILLIKQYPEQEIGSHTFSHFYCLEPGQNKEDFKADISFAQKVALRFGITLTSLVFPRNQFNDEYLQICKDLGIICYRGNESSWLYKAKNGAGENLFRRAVRLLDAYINLSGHNCYNSHFIKKSLPINIPASRFLRPYSKRLSFLDILKLQRIKSGMTHAAKNNLIYHLWWHPHNFGINQNENFAILDKILNHYQLLHKKYNFKSSTMTELATIIINDK